MSADLNGWVGTQDDWDYLQSLDDEQLGDELARRRALRDQAEAMFHNEIELDDEWPR